jgi:hypothetical protein
MSESRYFFKFTYLTLKEDILCQKEDGRTWPKKEDMSSQRRAYGNPTLQNASGKLKIHGEKFKILKLSIYSYFWPLQRSLHKIE